MEHSIALYDSLTAIFGIAAAVFLVVTVVVYILYGIYGIIRKRLGLTKKQALKQMRREARDAEEAGQKTVHGEMFTAAERVPGRLRRREEQVPARKESILETLEREQMERKKEDAPTVMLDEDAPTTALEGDMPTMPLSAQAWELESAYEETGVLNADGQTMQLRGEQTEILTTQQAGEIYWSGEEAVPQFTLLRHIMMIHTDEQIA